MAYSVGFGPQDAAFGGYGFYPPSSNGSKPVDVIIQGLPDDVKDRELKNMLRFLPGFQVRGWLENSENAGIRK